MMSGMSDAGADTVWMVHLDRGEADDDVKGTLEACEDGLLFSRGQGTRAPPARLTFDAIRQRQARPRLSPVLMVIEWALDEDRRAARPSTSRSRRRCIPQRARSNGSDVHEARARSLRCPSSAAASGRPSARTPPTSSTAGISKRDLISGWAKAVQERMRAGR